MKPTSMPPRAMTIEGVTKRRMSPPTAAIVFASSVRVPTDDTNTGSGLKERMPLFGAQTTSDPTVPKKRCQINKLAVSTLKGSRQEYCDQTFSIAHVRFGSDSDIGQ